MSEYTQVDLQIGTEAQFETKKTTLPEGVLVGLTDPIHENELDSALQTKLNGKASTSYVQGYVQGNPTESGTTTLTKLKVDNTVYNIPQGGGGSNVEVVQTTGQSTTAVMSQKAVTEALNGKASTSYVQGNPTENGTVDLAKLKVGETVYNVPQGGGGGKLYKHHITFDVYYVDESYPKIDGVIFIDIYSSSSTAITLNTIPQLENGNAYIAWLFNPGYGTQGVVGVKFDPTHNEIEVYGAGSSSSNQFQSLYYLFPYNTVTRFVDDYTEI